MTCKDNRDGSCSVEYTPTEAGEYDVSIQFAEKHIPGSPFKVYTAVRQTFYAFPGLSTGRYAINLY